MITALGWLWFLGDLSIAWQAHALLLTVALLVAAFSPLRIYHSKYNHVIAAIYLIGIVGTIPIIFKDIHRLDYPAMIIRIVAILVLGTLAKEAISNNNTNSIQVAKPVRHKPASSQRWDR